MGSNIIELAKLGHERATELKASCGAVDVRSLAQLISDLATQLEVQYVCAEESQREFRSADITMQNLEAKLKQSKIDADCYKKGMEASNVRLVQLAAENAGLKAAHPQPFGPVMMKALDAYEKHQDDVPETGMLDAFFILRDSIRVDTTSTDAFLAEVRAQAHKEGAHFVANRMLAAWDAGFIEDTAKNSADIARMILTSTEFMADAPEGDFDRSFADGVLKDIAAQLRKGAAL